MADRPPLAPVVALTLAAGVAAAVQQYAPVLLDLPVPQVSVAVFAVSAVGFVLSPVLVFALGYWTGRRVDVPRTYPSVAAAFGVGGGLATLAGFAAVLLVGVIPDAGNLGMAAFSATHTAVVRGVSYAVTGVAGAAVAHFRVAERNP
jgi:hypothetical protein